MRVAALLLLGVLSVSEATTPSGLRLGDKDVVEDPDPFDIQCWSAGMGSDDAESVCVTTLDEESKPCVWCNVAGVYGLCVSDYQASVIGQYLTCDDDNNNNNKAEDIQDPKDAVLNPVLDCLPNMDEDSCNSATDEDGTSCDWCNTSAGFGVCLSADAAEMAKQFGPLFQCDTKADEAIPPSVYECLKNVAEDDCKVAVDDDGAPCDWCNTAAGFGVCLSAEEAELAKQFGPLFECDGGTLNGAISPTLLDCLKNIDSDTCDSAVDEDGGACEWCDTAAGFGLCLSGDAVEIAKQFGPLFQCDDKDASMKMSSIEFDPTCIFAGYMGGDESACDAAQDEGGYACVWCTAPGSSQGVCLSQDQANMAQQWLTCDSQSIEIA